MKIRDIIFAGLASLLLVPVSHAVVVAGGDNGWELSFDGNVNGFYVYSDRDPLPRADRNMVISRDAADGGDYLLVQPGARANGNISGAGDATSRIRTGLLPAFFSFNVRSPEVNGYTGTGRISFAPQIQNNKTKNRFGSQVDLREAFFNIESRFGTLSVGRTLSLFQRHNILTDMTLFGTGAEGGSDAGGTTLGRIGFGYVYPQFNARISYRTPEVYGFQVEVGAYDPSRICSNAPYSVRILVAPADNVVLCANKTDTPRWEGEATFSANFTNDASMKVFLSGMYQEAEGGPIADPNNTGRIRNNNILLDVESVGIAGGIVLDFTKIQLVASAYSGEALGTTLMLDTDALDALGNERDHDGYILQATYTHKGNTKFGVSYGASRADETSNDTATRTQCGTPSNPMDMNGQLTSFCSRARLVEIKENNAFTIGVYHDVTSWFKVIAEYTKATVEWHDGEEQESDVYSFGGFFTW